MSTNCLTESETRSNRTSIFAYPLIGLIYLYRYTLSPLIGQSCRFYPTCSHYAEDALRKYGPLRGSWMAVCRVLRCHPWHDGGYDPVG
ncbi:membrane protein insertion efficiency factor YidD [candidate division GN15 bacterium]|uniref:Putative membrane protein insertion efficiency factor n=1 Tax=candidate division GN15 bacterium TaxID=2072418 RepID=A0A855WX96_9BACT|nr:MAG: membrane protein insertion efficiency factor YidD [candidate division GN15 bacterium]